MRFWNNLHQVRNNLHQVRNNLHQVRNNLHQVRNNLHQVRNNLHQVRLISKDWKAKYVSGSNKTKRPKQDS